MPDQLKLSGVIKLIDEPQQINDKLTKRLLVLTTADKYPQDVAFEFLNDSGDLLDRFAPGMEADVSFNVRGREYNGKYYVSLNGWKIEVAASTAPTPTPTTATPRQNNNPALRAQRQGVGIDDGNDLPF